MYNMTIWAKLCHCGTAQQIYHRYRRCEGEALRYHGIALTAAAARPLRVVAAHEGRSVPAISSRPHANLNSVPRVLGAF